MPPRARIAAVSAVLPPDERSSADIAELIRASSRTYKVAPRLIELTTGIRSRRVAAPDVNSSDLAAEAGRRVLETTQTDPESVDLLIFASASQDLMEPATANLVQEKVGTNCPVFDVKNACNSFLNGLQIADSFIRCGAYRRVLVTVGETPSRGIKWSVANWNDFKKSFLGYTLGDAGAAALLEPSDDDRGFFYQSFRTVSKYWDIATILGGGSMYGHGKEHAFIQGDGAVLRNAFIKIGPGILTEALEATETCLADFRRIFVHQVSKPTLTEFSKISGVSEDKIEVTIQDFGNMASASLPVALALAHERGDITAGDLIMLIGMAAGVSLGVLLMRF